MKKQHFFVTFLTLIFMGLLGYYILHSGYYPIAIVNGELIGAYRLNKESSARYTYYTRTAAISGIDVRENNSFIVELRQSVLSGLIDETIINQELRKLFNSDIQAVAERRVGEHEAEIGELDTVASVLYGLSLEDFKKIVLVPQAKKDLLREKLAERGNDADKWIIDAKKSARVRIFSTRFSWNGAAVVAKNKIEN